jgi:hypothetical protein
MLRDPDPAVRDELAYTRGYDPELGWLHAAAHGADLLRAFGLLRRPRRPQNLGRRAGAGPARRRATQGKDRRRPAIGPAVFGLIRQSLVRFAGPCRLRAGGVLRPLAWKFRIAWKHLRPTTCFISTRRKVSMLTATKAQKAAAVSAARLPAAPRSRSFTAPVFRDLYLPEQFLGHGAHVDQDSLGPPLGQGFRVGEHGFVDQCSACLTPYRSQARR